MERNEVEILCYCTLVVDFWGVCLLLCYFFVSTFTLPYFILLYFTYVLEPVLFTST